TISKFHLCIPSIQWNCHLMEQNPQILSVQEGEECTLYCSYPSSFTDRLHWYRQALGTSLEPLFVLLSNGEVKQKDQFRASLDTKAKRSTLHIMAAQHGLAATYFCAVDPQCSPATVSLYPNLQQALQDHPRCRDHSCEPSEM
uniref:Ig-like domain-containing protein n=1 Tax=Oryctolagus cuniculus TaxID=9986 RepID=A0A5F9D1F0_RABIT